MGGHVIVEAAAQMPGRVIGLVGVDTFQIVGVEKTLEEVRKALPPPAGFEAALRDWLSQRAFPPGSDPSLVKDVSDGMCLTPPEIAIPVHGEMMMNGPRQGEGLTELNLRTITINKLGGPMPEDFADYGIQVVRMPDVGHFCMMEDPETFNRLLLEAIDQFLEADGTRVLES